MSRPSVLVRSTARLFLPRFECSASTSTSVSNIAMPDPARPRIASPRSTCSILITSAPQSARIADAAGTNVCSATSRMRIPSMGRLMWFLRRVAVVDAGSVGAPAPLPPCTLPPHVHCRPVGQDSSGFREINAVTLAVGDMDRAVAFYADLGFPIVVGGSGAPFTTLGAGRTFVNLQLVEGWTPRVGGPSTHAQPADVWGRVIFWVDDVDAIHERALAHGHRPEFPPTDAP